MQIGQRVLTFQYGILHFFEVRFIVEEISELNKLEKKKTSNDKTYILVIEIPANKPNNFCVRSFR